jgi:hypothetical protein
MSATEDQTPKASGARQLHNPLQYTPIDPKVITERPHLEATHSETELEHDSVMADILSQGTPSCEVQADLYPVPLTFSIGILHRVGAQTTQEPCRKHYFISITS